MDEKEQLNKALNLSYFLLKFRPRTKKEIEVYLKKKSQKHSFTPDDIQSAIQTLDEQGLIDDKEFIDWFVKSRINQKQKSEWVLKRELAQHGVQKELIGDYFQQKPIDEEAMVFKALSQRWSRWQSLSILTRFKKAADFLLRRGFKFELIKKAIAKFEKNV